jgi:hypothetical protein
MNVAAGIPSLTAAAWRPGQPSVSSKPEAHADGVMIYGAALRISLIPCPR